MSELLERLDRQLRSAPDPDQRAELLARLSAYLGRLGRFDEARRHIDALRKIYGDGRSGRVTVWIMLAEGLIRYFEDLSPQAIDKVTRAMTLGAAMKYSPILGLAAAWKAHMAFQFGDYESMVRALNLSSIHADSEDLDAATRRAMVLSNAYMLCGDRTSSAKWFNLGRESALKNGDRASVEALMHNHAAFLTAWLRAENCIEPVSKQELRDLRMKIASARNFQDLMKIGSMTAHIHLCEARLNLMDGEYLVAMEKFRTIKPELPQSEYSFGQAYVEIEACFAQAKGGQLGEAIETYRKLPPIDMSRLDIDEQLVAVWMRRQLAKLDEEFGAQELLAIEFNELADAYVAFKDELLDLLKQVTLQPN